MTAMQYSCIFCGIDVDEDSETVYVDDYACDMPICDQCAEEMEMVTDDKVQ